MFASRRPPIPAASFKRVINGQKYRCSFETCVDGCDKTIDNTEMSLYVFPTEPDYIFNVVNDSETANESGFVGAL